MKIYCPECDKQMLVQYPGDYELDGSDYGDIVCSRGHVLCQCDREVCTTYINPPKPKEKAKKKRKEKS